MCEAVMDSNRRANGSAITRASRILEEDGLTGLREEPQGRV